MGETKRMFQFGPGFTKRKHEFRKKEFFQQFFIKSKTGRSGFSKASS
jgi:hypothetical protein